MMERIEWMAEKATEIGFDELSFLNCQFSERKVVKTPRIDKIVISAVKQSHKAWKPVVNELESFQEISSLSDDTDGKDAADITVLVGPEGDFSIDEVRLALENGYESVSLGTSRLRTETAGLVAVHMAHIARRL